MIRHLLSVGGFTLLSRVTGFLSVAMQSAIMGAGVVSDAFFIAQRLPNSFRSIFGEGAFNAAYVPSYARVLETEGESEAQRFSSQILTLLLLSQLVLLAIAWTFMPQVVALLAPGFSDEPQKFEAAVTLSRITFPYLLFISLVSLQGGVLNSVDRFAAVAATRAQLGLDGSAFTRYVHWLGGLLHGDLDLSYTYRVPVRSLIAERIGLSLPLAAYALVLAILIALPVALIAVALAFDFLNGLHDAANSIATRCSVTRLRSTRAAGAVR